MSKRLNPLRGVMLGAAVAALAILAGCAVPDVRYRENLSHPKEDWRGDRFARYSGYDDVAGTFQLSSTTLKKEGRPKVTLLGAVHVGDESYYREVQETLDAADLVLFELVKPESFDTRNLVPTSGGMYGELADCFGLSEQMAELDYRRDNFQWLDMTQEELGRRSQAIIDRCLKRLSKAWREQQGGFLGAAQRLDPALQRACAAMAVQLATLPGVQAGATTELAAAEPITGTIQLMMRLVLIPLKAEKHYYAAFKTEKAFEDKYKHMLASGLVEQNDMQGQFDALRGTSEFADAIIDALEEFQDLIVIQRNVILADGIEEITAQDDAPENIVVFYGAGHFPDLVERLQAQGWKPQKKQRWFTAIDIGW